MKWLLLLAAMFEWHVDDHYLARIAQM